MIFEGFLGTQADLIIDTILVMFVLWPFVVLLAIRFAKAGLYRPHRNFQIIIFVCVFLLVLALEIDLRFTDLLDKIKETAIYHSMLAKAVFGTHLFVAIPTFIIWLTLLFRSIRQYETELPGSFSNHHIFWGKALLIGLILTSVTGIALYIIVFVLT